MRNKFVVGLMRAAALAVLAVAGLICSGGELAHAQQPAATPWHPPAPIVATQGAGYPMHPPAAPTPPPPPDLRLERSTVYAALGFFISPVQESSFDHTLTGRGITSATQWGASAEVATRVSRWFWLGGRAGFRKRDFDSGDIRMLAYGLEAEGTGQLRIQIGSTIELIAQAGLGAAHAGVTYNDVFEGGIVPRFSGGIGAGLWFVGDVRAVVRMGYDYFFTPRVNGAGDRLDLGGVAFYLGLEWRPTREADS